MVEEAKALAKRQKDLTVIWLLVMACVSPLLVAGSGIWYTSYVQHRSDQRWCDLMKTIDRPSLPPPVNKDQQLAREKFHKLRIDLGC